METQEVNAQTTDTAIIKVSPARDDAVLALIGGVSNKSIIAAGDTIHNDEGFPILVSSVELGRYGVLVKGDFIHANVFCAYCPYEMPAPDTEIRRWNGWGRLAFVTLPNSRRLAALAWKVADSRPDEVELYDKQFEEMGAGFEAGRQSMARGE